MYNLGDEKGGIRIAFILYRTNPKNGVTYAYQSESYRDPVTKQPKSRRTYLGRVNPETKLIIPKGESGTHNTSKLGEPVSRGTMPADTAKVIADLRDRVDQLQKENDAFKAQVRAQVDKTNDLVLQLKHVIESFS